MGHFKIDLVSGRQADVRYGKITEKMINFWDLFRRRRGDRVKRIGYVVKLDPPQRSGREYRFLRSIEGIWVKEDSGAFRVSEDDELSIEIKKGIDDYERTLF